MSKVYQKVQTTVRNDGGVESRRLGVVSVTNFERDVEDEHQYYSKIARGSSQILTVEQTETTLVIVYNGGTTRVINYVLKDNS